MTSRYYDSYSSEGEIKPGKISAELRGALNLPENDLPIWIYRMRALGYPPGWLKKAIVDTSDIFDTESFDPDLESKKRKQPFSGEVQYDHSKLIEYPGFNAPMPDNCNDYHYYVNMPAMLEHQQLEYAKKHMNAFKPAQIPKRIKSIHQTSIDSDKTLDDSVTSLSTLNRSKNGESPGDSSPDNEKDDEKNSSSTNKIPKSLSTPMPEEIKLLSKGSPMPKPVQRAPLEKFSEGVEGELLYFENIPNSTGKFDSIRGLLNSIRKSKSTPDIVDTSINSTKSE